MDTLDATARFLYTRPMSPETTELISLLALGLLAGLLGGLVGLGGSIVIIPVLTLLLHRNQHVSQAAAMIVNGDVIENIRIACGGVQCIPRRLTAVEEAVKGSRRNDETAALAGATAIRGAKPLNHNHFKVPLMESLVRRAVREG